MTDHLRFPYDRPDHYDDGMDPPFNKRIRHHDLEHPFWTWAFIVILCLSALGGVGYLGLILSGVVE